MTQTPIRSTEFPSSREVVFKRLLDAPRELVWKVWTDPRHLHEWWGPTGFTTTTLEFSFVPGGLWSSVMHGPDGTDYPTIIIFREITPPSRLVYENAWDLPDAPIDFVATITFEAEGAKTRFAQRMTFRDEASFKIAVERYGVLEGGRECFERLAEYLAGQE